METKYIHTFLDHVKVKARSTSVKSITLLPYVICDSKLNRNGEDSSTYEVEATRTISQKDLKFRKFYIMNVPRLTLGSKVKLVCANLSISDFYHPTSKD